MTYDDHRAALIQYLKAKVDICDWHAVRDACVDIEILEAREKEKRGAGAARIKHGWIAKDPDNGYVTATFTVEDVEGKTPPIPSWKWVRVYFEKRDDETRPIWIDAYPEK